MSKKNKKGKLNPQQGPMSRPQADHRRWPYVVLFVFSCLLYANTIQHDFAFDDSVVITGNKYTKQGLAGIKTLATKDLFYGIYGTSLDLEGGRWRPFTLVMFAIEYHFFGENAHPYHFINVLLYGLAVMILFLLLKEVFPRNHLLAFLATLLFAAHPIHTEVVANIKSRDEIVSFLFLCLMLFFIFRSVKTGEKRPVLYAALCYFSALLSKESGITFLAVIPLSLFCFTGKNLRQSLLFTWPFFLTAVVYIAIRTSLVGMIGDKETFDVTDNPFLQLHFPDLPTALPFIEKFSTICWIVLKYLLLLVFPHPLTSDYGFNEVPAITLLHPKSIAALLVFAGLLYYAFRSLLPLLRKKEKTEQPVQADPSKFVPAFSILYFFFTISIVSNLFFLIGTNLGERFAYISSMGYCLALAYALIRYAKPGDLALKKDFYKQASLSAPMLVILGLYSYKTLTRNPDWANNKTLFTADVKTSTNSANAHYYYANTLFTDHINDDPSATRDSFFVAARTEFRKAMAINPYFHYCYYNIGLIWEKLGNPDSAVIYQQKTIDLKPANSMAQYMAKGALGLVYGKLKGDFEKAIPLLKEALANKPEDTGYHENLGICYAMKGDFDNSIKEFEAALKLKTEIKKEDARVYMNLALSWKNKGDEQKYNDYLQKAFQIDPSLKK